MRYRRRNTAQIAMIIHVEKFDWYSKDNDTGKSLFIMVFEYPGKQGYCHISRIVGSRRSIDLQYKYHNPCLAKTE